LSTCSLLCEKIIACYVSTRRSLLHQSPSCSSLTHTHTHSCPRTHTHTNVNTYIGSTQCDFCPSNSWSSASSVAQADCLCQAGYSGLFVRLNDVPVRVFRESRVFCQRVRTGRSYQETSSTISLSRSLALSLARARSLSLALSRNKTIVQRLWLHLSCGRNGAGRWLDRRKSFCALIPDRP
jgi:hypothetical protein